MPLPTERELLDLWERGFAAPRPARAAALLRLAVGQGALEEMTLGERERALLELRRGLLGSRMSALAECPHCGECHDVEFDLDVLLSASPAELPRSMEIPHDDLTLVVRPLTLRDCAEALGSADPAAALALRCVVQARRGSESIDPRDLTTNVRATVARALADLDPLCELSTTLQCSACNASWTTTLDAAAYLWRELHMWAEGVLREVHALASAYGWGEEQVLRLSPWRRAAYVAMAGR